MRSFYNRLAWYHVRKKRATNFYNKTWFDKKITSISAVCHIIHGYIRNRLWTIFINPPDSTLLLLVIQLQKPVWICLVFFFWSVTHETEVLERETGSCEINFEPLCFWRCDVCIMNILGMYCYSFGDTADDPCLCVHGCVSLHFTGQPSRPRALHAPARIRSTMKSYLWMNIV